MSEAIDRVPGKWSSRQVYMLIIAIGLADPPSGNTGAEGKLLGIGRTRIARSVFSLLAAPAFQMMFI